MQNVYQKQYLTSYTLSSLALVRQQGFILIVCLVLLFVVTALGLTTMRSTGLELKMAGSMKDRSAAFEAAEQALKAGESWLASVTLTKNTSYYAGCTPGSGICFNSTCVDGLCASYNAGDLYVDPNLASSCVSKLAQPATPRWQWDGSVAGQPNLWLDANRHREVGIGVINIDPDIAAPKYIVEFMCYADKDGNDCSLAADAAAESANCAPLFRLTALATGIDNSTKVMLQSTYMKAN